MGTQAQRLPEIDRLVAFPIGDDRIRVIFSRPVDEATATDPARYRSAQGLAILKADLRRSGFADETRTAVELRTEPMSGYALVVDTLIAEGVRDENGRPALDTESRPFVHGIASIPGLQWPQEADYPFKSRFGGLVATASCQKDGGVNSNKLIDTFGYCFLHVERGGPFNSIKVKTQKHVPGIDEEVERLWPLGLSPHVLWSGGEVQTVDGETCLVDTGYMEGSILPATPKRFPPPFRIRTSDVAESAAGSLRAKSLQGVIVRFEHVTVDALSAPGEAARVGTAGKLRSFVFHDESGAPLTAVVLDSVRREVRAGDTFDSIRALVHQPERGRYEALIELDSHFNYPLGQPDGRSRHGEPQEQLRA